MKPRCWPGCLARLSNADYPANEGAILEVVRRCGPGDLWAHADELVWVVKPTRPMVHDFGCDSHLAYCADAKLTPITPPPPQFEVPAAVHEPIEAI